MSAPAVTRCTAWHADLIEASLDAVLGELAGTVSQGRKEDLLYLRSVLEDMWSGERTDDDIGYWIEQYDLADAIGIDLVDLRIRGKI